MLWNFCGGEISAKRASQGTPYKQTLSIPPGRFDRYLQLFSLYVDISVWLFVIKKLTVIPKCELLCSNCKRLIAS